MLVNTVKTFRNDDTSLYMVDIDHRNTNGRWFLSMNIDADGK